MAKIQALAPALDGLNSAALRQTISMVVTDMTEARRNEELLRALTHRVVHVQETERGRVAHHLARANSRIDAYNQRHARRSGFLNHFGPHPVTVAQTMRDMEGGVSARELNALFENYDRAGSIGIVVSVQKDVFFALAGAAETRYGLLHAC